jgi:glycosyltransferase involved in cell wall biosynthesis
MPRASRLLKVFTPSFADDVGTNAQNLTVKEVVARLDPARFRVTMFFRQPPDPRIAARKNTILLPWKERGNTLRTLLHMVTDVPDVYFFPRIGPLDQKFFGLRRMLRWHTAVVTYIVSGAVSHGPVPAEFLRNLREANAVYGNNRYLTQIVTDKLGFPAATIYDGIDRRYYFLPESRNHDRGRAVIALCAGSFRPYKRMDLVVRQAARLPQVEFRIAGSGEEEDACRRLAAELGCANVHFLGHLGQAELGDEMRRADIFLFPSELEGHPQVLLQAAGCGLPCVAMNSYYPDAVVDGKTGFLARSVDDLAQKLDVLVNDTELRVAMSAAAARHSAKFDWDQVAAQWAQAFEKVAGHSG